MSTIAAPTDKGYRDAYRVWSGLSAGPWLGRQVPLHDDPLLTEIDAIRFSDQPQHVYDMGFCLLLRHALERGGFVHREAAEHGWIRWVKSETAPEPDTRSYTEREQEILDQARRREQRLLDQDARFRASLAEQEARIDPRMNEIASALRRLNVIDRAGTQQLVAEGIASAIEPLRRQLAELSEQLAAATSELAALREQISQQTPQTTARRLGRRAK